MTACSVESRRLAGKTALVTGAAGGIGSTVAELLAREGARVVCADYDGGAAARIAESIGASAVGVALDVSDEIRVGQTIARVADRYGLDILCNIAGIAGPQVPADHTDVDEWDATFAVNARGTFLMIKHAVHHLRERRGSIVNIASALAMIGWRSESAYGPSKAAVVQMTKSAALDFAPEVRVNAVLPGAVRTPMITSVLEGSADMEETLTSYGSIHPYGKRLLDPSAIANAVLFLVSDDASFITGACVPVDAGMLATGRSADGGHGNGDHALGNEQSERSRPDAIG